MAGPKSSSSAYAHELTWGTSLHTTQHSWRMDRPTGQNSSLLLRCWAAWKTGVQLPSNWSVCNRMTPCTMTGNTLCLRCQKYAKELKSASIQCCTTQPAAVTQRDSSQHTSMSHAACRPHLLKCSQEAASAPHCVIKASLLQRSSNGAGAPRCPMQPADLHR